MLCSLGTENIGLTRSGEQSDGSSSSSCEDVFSCAVKTCAPGNENLELTFVVEGALWGSDLRMTPVPLVRGLTSVMGEPWSVVACGVAAVVEATLVSTDG